MNIFKLVLLLVATLGLCGLSSEYVSAAVVTFDNFNDTHEDLFEGATVDPNDGNRLIIELVDFVADGSSPDTSSAFDTFAVTINAPAGYLITGIDYLESGRFSPAGGTVIVNGSIVIDGEVSGFDNVFSGSSTGGWFIDPSFVLNDTSTIVSITNALFALGSGAMISKETAQLAVELKVIPLPASVILMGSALAGLLLLRRRPDDEDTSYW